MSEGYLGRVLFPGFTIYLHGNGLGEKDSHLVSLTNPVGLTQSDLHLGDVETREDTEHLQLSVLDGGSEVEVFMSGAERPGPDPRTPAGNVQHHH